jgi:sulfate adenylyltransferase subunit 2
VFVKLDLIVHVPAEAREQGVNPFRQGARNCCAILKTKALVDALTAGSFDAAVGGARRDEEESRAQEGIYSFRDSKGQWDPRNQRPEPWDLFNGRVEKGESIRVFPLSNWTELDVWQYIPWSKSRWCHCISPGSGRCWFAATCSFPSSTRQSCYPARSRSR